MNDDWRLQIDIREETHSRLLLEHLDARELQHDLSSAFHDRVIVTRDNSRVFLYAGTREQAERARDLIGTLASKHGWTVDANLRRWHPEAEEWEDPESPLPNSDAARKVEHDEEIAAEDKLVQEQGYPGV